MSDEMDVIVRCNNCGQPTRFGETRMISGFVGCDNEIEGVGLCYFNDLMPRVVDWKANRYEDYISGKVYRWRDSAHLTKMKQEER